MKGRTQSISQSFKVTSEISKPGDPFSGKIIVENQEGKRKIIPAMILSENEANELFDIVEKVYAKKARA